MHQKTNSHFSTLTDRMDHVITIFLISCISLLIISSTGYVASFDVTKYGAVGDGRTDDSWAFLKTWAAVCGADASVTPTLIVPSGKTFLLKPVQFKGPCRPWKIKFEIVDVSYDTCNLNPLFPSNRALSCSPDTRRLGNIGCPQFYFRDYGGNHDFWLYFWNVNWLNIYGSGQIDGRGSVWWSTKEEDGDHYVKSSNRPTELKFFRCNGLKLSGLKHLNSPRNHISICKSIGATLSYLTITAPDDSPNTDGIDISQSTQIQIHDSYIGTGDDCVAINGGTSFVNITKVACGPGHGISVGSLGPNGAYDTVEEVHVKDCNFTRTTNGAWIKTWQGGSGYAKKISFEQITLTEVQNPIIINQYYTDYAHPKDASTVQVSDITYVGVRGSSTTKEAITLKCSNTVGCTNIVLKQIDITSTYNRKKTQSVCINAHGVCTDCNPPVPCLS